MHGQRNKTFWDKRFRKPVAWPLCLPVNEPDRNDMPYTASLLSLTAALKLTRDVPTDSGFLCDKPAVYRRNIENESITMAAITSIADYVTCWHNRAIYFIFLVFRMKDCRNVTITLGTSVRPAAFNNSSPAEYSYLKTDVGRITNL